jgi:aminoglycoside phosphotransferase (APT) family kinase protein
MFRADGPELAAIVDWELASIGDPLVDLGWVVATWPGPEGPVAGTVGAHPWLGFPAAGDLVEHYRRGSERDLSRVRWYTVLGCFRLGILVEGTHARSYAGKADSAIGSRLHAQAVFLFERASKLIAGNRPLSTID